MAAKISYIDRMEHFIQHYSMQLTLHEIRLFLCLFHLNNKARWAEWFECDNVSLALMLRLPERNLIRAKNGLKEKGLIDFQPGKKGKPSKYRLMELGENIPLSNYTVQNEREIHNYTVQNESDSDSDSDSVSDSVSDSETPGKSQAPRGPAGPLRKKKEEIRNKNIEREVRERKKAAASLPPSLDEIKAYIQEKGLPVDPVAFFDYYEAGNWQDSKGLKVKNWKQKAQTWARYEKGAVRDEQPKINKSFWDRFDNTGPEGKEDVQ